MTASRSTRRPSRKHTVGAQSRGPFPELAESILEWRLSIQSELNSTVSTKRREELTHADAVFAGWEKYCRGQISREELFSNAQAPYKVPFLPWIGPSLTWDLLQKIWSEQRARGTPAVKEFLDWCNWLFIPPPGRQPNPRTFALGQEAHRMRSSGKTWSQIARKLCPDRGPGHTCTKRCQDRIRMAVKAFKSDENQPGPREN